jgi:hypothetical protein
MGPNLQLKWFASELLFILCGDSLLAYLAISNFNYAVWQLYRCESLIARKTRGYACENNDAGNMILPTA